VYTLLRADLLAKRRDAGVSDKCGVERIHAFPRCISCMGAAKSPPSMSGWAGRVIVGTDVRLSEIFHSEGLQCEGGHESYL
jgi:hypothetical protein